MRLVLDLERDLESKKSDMMGSTRLEREDETFDSTRTRRQNDDVFDANHEDRIEEHRGLDQTEKSDTDEKMDQVSTGFQIPCVSVVPCS